MHPNLTRLHTLADRSIVVKLSTYPFESLSVGEDIFDELIETRARGSKINVLRNKQKLEAITTLLSQQVRGKDASSTPHGVCLIPATELCEINRVE